MAYSKIVVGVDGSETAGLALKEAARLAERESATLVIVSSFQPPNVREISKWQSESPAEMTWRFTGTAVVEEVLAGATNALGGFKITAKTRSEEGDPAEVLIRVAEEEKADLLVVGNKGMTSAKRFLLGSVPNKISHHSPCDLMIVKTT